MVANVLASYLEDYAGVKLPTAKSRSKCAGPRQWGDRSQERNHRFFDVNQAGNEENQKTSKMKSAPNKLLKTMD
jgi:hypothetical protein